MNWTRRLAASAGLAVAAAGIAVPLSLSSGTASATTPLADVPVASVSQLAEGKAPQALKDDLKKAWAAPDGQRVAALHAVLSKAVDGDYGAQVQTRAKKLQTRLEGMNADLRSDLQKAIELPQDQRRAAFKDIRTKIKDGDYGDQVKRNAKLLQRVRHHRLFG